MTAVLLVSLVLAALAAAAADPTEPASAPAAAPQAAPAVAPAEPAAKPVPVVVTVERERIAAPLVEIRAGALVLDSQPPRQVPLEEIERIENGRPANLAVEWLGQDNHDFAQPANKPGGNGIQDIHLRLSGLPENRRITQIMATCTRQSLIERFFGTKSQSWQWNVSQPENVAGSRDSAGRIVQMNASLPSSNWKLALVRADASWLDTADVYLEPELVDSFNHQFTLAITFDGRDTSQVAVRAPTHTDGRLAVGTGVATEAKPAVATVYLENKDVWQGEVLAWSEESLRLRTAWKAEVSIPLVQVLAVSFDTLSPGEPRAQFAGQLAQAGAEDVAWILGKDQALAKISGSSGGLTDGKWRFTYDGQPHTINQSRLLGVVFAAHPAASASSALRQVFRLATGEVVSGQWKSIGGDAFELETAWGEPVSLPREIVRDILFRNGRMAYLSDIEPESVEETPYFGRRMPYRRDQGLSGGALVMRGEYYTKGLAVHSRCRLTYALAGRYERFRALVGFDDSADARGRVACRVLADGKELFAQDDLRAEADPQPLDLAINGAKQLVLEVDFGQDEDIGDRVIWADARIFRAREQ